jgi:hypothetical protein
LTAAHSFAAADTAPQVASIMPALKTPREFAIASYSLLKASPTVYANLVKDMLALQFPDARDEPRLVMLRRAVEQALQAASPQKQPPLVDLLAASFNGQKQPVLYSFQRKNRLHMGIAVVREANGLFARNSNGQLFHVPQLANALSNLPGTITNGNTPQGLMSIIGSGTARNQWIGPTPHLESKVPFEAKLAYFRHEPESSDAPWSLAAYRQLLPASWANYEPFQEAYYAGQAGRDEIIVHGMTINPDYYKGESYYPAAPSAGCLVTYEVWDPSTGVLVKSDQLTLAKVFMQGGQEKGFLVIVELDDQDKAVSLEEVLSALKQAEARLAK